MVVWAGDQHAVVLIAKHRHNHLKQRPTAVANNKVPWLTAIIAIPNKDRDRDRQRDREGQIDRHTRTNTKVGECTHPTQTNPPTFSSQLFVSNPIPPTYVLTSERRIRLLNSPDRALRSWGVPVKHKSKAEAAMLYP